MQIWRMYTAFTTHKHTFTLSHTQHLNTCRRKALVDSGCLMGRGVNSKKGTHCLRCGTSVQKLSGHFPTFCPMERHPWVHFTMFVYRKGTLEGGLSCFMYWKGTPEGTLPHYNKRKETLDGTSPPLVHRKGTLEGTSSRFLYHRGIQEGAFKAFFLTLGQRGEQLPLLPPLWVCHWGKS